MADAAKSVLITGCAPGGIGHSLALEFHSHGLRVFASARKADSMPELADKGITCLSCEVDKTDSIEALRKEVFTLTGGRLDYLVNNAGRNYTVPGLDVELEEIRLTFEVNVFAVMMMCQAFAPMLIEAKGTIIQIGSVAAINPFVFGSVYNSSKAALHQYSNTLRVELAPFGVNVMTIVTGGVQSRIARTDRVLPKGSYYRPVEEEYLRRVKYSQEGAMPNAEYAKNVVNQALTKHPKFHYWTGAKVWMVWILHSLGRSIENWVMSRIFNLYKLYPGASAKSKSA